MEGSGVGSVGVGGKDVPPPVVGSSSCLAACFVFTINKNMKNDGLSIPSSADTYFKIHPQLRFPSC